MKTRTEKLASKIKKIVAEKKTEIENLSFYGPNGGTNALYIDGWSHVGNGTITKAAGMAGCPRANYWSGHMPTPATALPSCVLPAIERAYGKIFGE
jgi:hypothetical protein